MGLDASPLFSETQISKFILWRIRNMAPVSLLSQGGKHGALCMRSGPLGTHTRGPEEASMVLDLQQPSETFCNPTTETQPCCVCVCVCVCVIRIRIVKRIATSIVENPCFVSTTSPD